MEFLLPLVRFCASHHDHSGEVVEYQNPDVGYRHFQGLYQVTGVATKPYFIETRQVSLLLTTPPNQRIRVRFYFESTEFSVRMHEIRTPGFVDKAKLLDEHVTGLMGHHLGDPLLQEGADLVWIQHLAIIATRP
ncbi:hypothetical protein PssiTeo3_28560 [Pseudomonas sichuanensis]|nr:MULTISPECIES: hypothetical protein [Pseudomonas]MDZ4019503.1 hypothetical protein [Pseudomonas sichuanensis]UVL89639.1 hypothetical protein LOY51_01640 [Pseudomonas sichuanensis]